MIMEAGNVASARTPRMPQATRHDAWQAGHAYEQYMGRSSRRIAPRSVDCLSPDPVLACLAVSCRPGLPSDAVHRPSAPAGLLAVDPSARFLAPPLAHAPPAHPP